VPPKPSRPAHEKFGLRPFLRSSPAWPPRARLALLCCLLLLLCPLPARAADPSPAQLQFFENRIRPIFVNNCYKCHSRQADKPKANLSLESRESILKGGDSGPAIVPGDPNRSLLIKAVRYTDPDLQMPPKDQPLSSQQVADLESWVKIGAPFPRAAASSLAADWAKNRREHWSFQPLKPGVVPEVADSNWVSTPVDAFILAKLEASRMKPAPPADKRALLRRATFDLTGLPPTPDEARAFEDDPSPGAFAKVVDRLLASPQYGERWGRFWLDTARYADTKGDIKQNQDVPQYPFAWVYRDYVVRSFNEDKPYNKFLLEQIAGDQMTPTKDRQELAAMGFLTLGPRFNDDINDIINDRIDVVCKGTMGLTVTCARCHDHKFDPIPQTDYYSLKGIFDSSTEPAGQPLMGEIKFTPAYTNFAAKLSATNQILADAQLKLRSLPRGGGADTNTANQRRILQQQVNQARRAAALLEATDPGSPPRATILRDVVKPHDDPLLIRGEAANKGDLVPRHFLTVIVGPNPQPIRAGSGRLQLAEDIISPRNPLTARVLVNRVWMHHFGEGFVTTPDDFGNQSDPPSHPELLDFLAERFMQDGWSIKKLHRLIMLSSVYQESSENNPRYAELDPQNRLLWRANIRRLEFEAVRDSILALGGQLDLTMGGPSVPLQVGEGGYSHRRTLYGVVDRRNLPEIYSQFDFANPDITMGKRYETTVPQQALFMMNSPLVVELARKLVNLPEFLDLTGPEARIRFLYDRIFQRPPTGMEIKLGKEFLADSPPAELITDDARERLRAERAGPGPRAAGAPLPGVRAGPRRMSLVSIGPNQLRAVGAWAKYAHALLQTNEVHFLN
jgi:hypothetical protein